MIRDILFDLDGTLIDSSPGILASFARVLAAHGLAPVVALDPSIIGPPLADTLRTLSGIGDETLLAALADDFKRDYDSIGYRQTEPYPGVPEGLAALAAAGLRLYIITNKRIVPTRKILDALGLASHFAGVHSRDETTPAAASKAAVVRRVMADRGIRPSGALFVGDTEEDAEAARDNELRFVHATWGYGAIGDGTNKGFGLEGFGLLPDLVRSLPLTEKAGPRPARFRTLKRLFF